MNIFALMGLVSKRLKRAKLDHLVPEMIAKVQSSQSYDEAVAVCRHYQSLADQAEL